MNERIKELLAELDIDIETDKGNMMNKILVRPKDLRQFAELIVKECAVIVEGAVNHREPASTYVGKIKQHFGVEE